VFSYFPTRESLVDAVITHVEQFILSIVSSAATPRQRTARETLLNMIYRCVEAVYEHPNYFRVWLDWSTSIHHDTWPRYLAHTDRVIAAYESVIEDGKRDGELPTSLDANDAARLITGEAHMATMMIFAGTRKKRLLSFVQHYVDAALSIRNN
jgi:TetR/AcrR family hemagglutinin/protease transcriptional regulator